MNGANTGRAMEAPVGKLLKRIRKISTDSQFKGSTRLANAAIDISIFPGAGDAMVVLATNPLAASESEDPTDAFAYWSVSPTRGIEDLRQGAKTGHASCFSATALVEAAEKA